MLVEGQSKNLTLSGSEFGDVHIGDFMIREVGYHYVDIKGVKREGDTFADIAAILIKADAPESIKFVKDDFYFGRRGPSDHLLSSVSLSEFSKQYLSESIFIRLKF